MAELKTKPTEQSVQSFLDQVPNETVRDDCYELIKLMKKITGSDPKMWGPSIIGFGKYHYKYDSGHEGDMCLTGFSPRKQNISLYVLSGFPGQEQLLEKIGKHKATKACVYIKRLKDVNIEILGQLISKSIQYATLKYA